MRRNEKGFTLIESLLQCVILSVVILLLVPLIHTTTHIQSTKQIADEMEWELASYDIIQLLPIDATATQYYGSYMQIKKGKEQYKISIEKSGEIFRSKDNGYELIYSKKGDLFSMRKLSTHEFKLTKRALDGTLKERTYYVPTVIQ